MKKAQIQSMESIVVLIIVTIMLVIGIIFFSNFQGQDSERMLDQERELNAVSVALQMINLEELRCSTATIRTERCVDKLKLNAFVGISNSNYDFYFDKFGNTNISIQLIHPKLEEEKIHIYSYTGNFTSASIHTFIPLTVFDPINNVRHFAIMEVRALS